MTNIFISKVFIAFCFELMFWYRLVAQFREACILHILLLLLSYVAGFAFTLNLNGSAHHLHVFFIFKKFTFLHFQNGETDKHRFSPRAEPTSSHPADIHQGAAVYNNVKLWPGCGHRGKLLLWDVLYFILVKTLIKAMQSHFNWSTVWRVCEGFTIISWEPNVDYFE